MVLLPLLLSTVALAWDTWVPAETLGLSNGTIDPDELDRALEDAAGRSPPGARTVRILTDNGLGQRVVADTLLPIVPPVLPKPGETPASAAPPPYGPTGDMPGPGDGALNDKAVYLSQCHGWIWYDSLGRFSTQRGNLYDTVEDFHNPEGANHYLVHYLENAGARVYTARERDSNPEMDIVDDGDPGYSESGTIEAGYRGFSNSADGWDYGEGPFDSGSTRRARQASGASFSWTPDVPSDGWYAVYVSWVPDSENTSAATYTFAHPGGITERVFDQRPHGWTWQYVETLWLAEGSSLTVRLDADGAVDDGWVSADAVRIGGGMADIWRNGTTSGRPRWEGGAIQYTQFQGAPTSTYDPYGSGDGSDPSSRSRWADWEHPTGEDAVYLSWHSNAGGGTGTSTYTYSGSSGAEVAGSSAFAELLQEELVGTFRDRWDSGWTDRGHRTAAFAEVSPANNNETPAALVELAFHDHVSDVEYLKDPEFRRDAARAMYRAVVRYFADEDGIPPVFLPEPPVDLAVVHNDGGGLDVSWSNGPSGGVLGDAATGFRLYTSADGRAWDGGVDVTGAHTTLSPDFGETVFVRVTAVNAGGESFPTEVMGARLSMDAMPPVLVVGAYDRYQITQLPWEDVPVLGNLRRFHPRRLNPFDGVAAHGRAIAGAGWYFDAVADERLPELDLSRYRTIVWMAGEESSADEAFSTDQQALIRSWLEDGGTLVVSGSEVLWDLDALGSEADQAFAFEVLGATMAADDSGTSEVDGEDILAGLVLDFGEADGAAYPAEYPDVPASDGTVIARYAGGEPAAVLSSAVAFFGFPFENIGDEGARIDTMAALLPALVPDWTAPEIPGDTGTPDSGGGGDGGDGGDGGLSTGPDGIRGPGKPGDAVDADKLGGCGCASARAAHLALWMPLALVAWGRRRQR